ncbi:MAG: CRISPR-associated protein Cas4 [Nitrosopumilus sp.]|nr:CRISPR-associated protein Cas4 [Nitrosopumilus sp.]
MPLTVTDVVEYAFCPKFTYFINVLGLDQYEQKRGTVIAGRKLHQLHERNNPTYVPHANKGKKLVARKFYSEKLDLSGKIDEAVETNSEIILIERKYSDICDMSDTLLVQLGLLSILIEENLGKPVRNAIVIFSKTTRKQITAVIDDAVKNQSLEILEKTRKVIQMGIMPDADFDNRCLNCCFRKICPVGSLNSE